MDEMDKFTLECFVNKQTYQKYLAKHDPELFQETQGFYEKLLLHQRDIECITDHLLLNPESEQYNKTLRDSFESYMKSVLYHLEVEKQDIHTTSTNTIYDEDAGDKDTDDMLIDVSQPPASSSVSTSSKFCSSAWETDAILSISPPPLVPRENSTIEYWKKFNVWKEKDE
tara:strand:- start:578 stop:1087 length:510 start_codon:yes stop_codon:yes gene_type:complete